MRRWRHFANICSCRVVVSTCMPNNNNNTERNNSHKGSIARPDPTPIPSKNRPPSSTGKVLASETVVDPAKNRNEASASVRVRPK